jgi:hypothetical protein
MFLKINKQLIPTNPDVVICLDNHWEKEIPRRPIMKLYDGDAHGDVPSDDDKFNSDEDEVC